MTQNRRHDPPLPALRDVDHRGREEDRTEDCVRQCLVSMEVSSIMLVVKPPDNFESDIRADRVPNEYYLVRPGCVGLNFALRG